MTATSASRFWIYRPFSRLRWAVTVSVLLLALAAEIAFRMTDPHRPLRGSVFSFATTATFALFLWRPPVAAIALVLLGIPGAIVGETGGYTVALAAATGIVVFSCSLWLAVGFVVAQLGWAAYFVATTPGADMVGVLVLLAIAGVSAAVGAGVLALARRTDSMKQALDEHDERLQSELTAERTRIADELHDIVAHDIAIVAMHARVLELTDDPETRATSQRAIGESASQALSEARRILHVVSGNRDLPDSQSEPAVLADLHVAIRGYADELVELAWTVDVVLDDRHDHARAIDLALARMCRESVTNIIKHTSSPGHTSIVLTHPRDRVVLEVTSDLSGAPQRQLPSSGYGLARMRERAVVLGGTFAAGIDGGRWVARLDVPRS